MVQSIAAEVHSLAMAPATLQVACFRVDGRDCAVDVLAIAEVLSPLPVTALPGSPNFVEGLIELRGQFLPLIDLRKRFGARDPLARSEGKYIVAPLGGIPVALVVDEVTGVERISAQAIQPAPALEYGKSFVAGVIKWEQRILMMLDITKLLNAQELAQLAAVA